MMMKGCESQVDGFAVGLELERTERASEYEEERNGDVIPQIMHRAVATTLFDCVVRYSISAETLAETLCMAKGNLDGLYAEAKKEKVVKVSPASVVEGRHGRCTHASPHAAKRYEACLGAWNACEASAKRARTEVGRFAKELHSRLEQVAEERYGERFAGVAKRSGGERCGFSRSVHRGVFVVSDGIASVRTDTGIYGSCVSAGTITKQGTYFEVVVLDDCEAGGVCIGVARAGKSPGLVGGDKHSIGLHSSGKLVRNGEFEPFGQGYGSGDFVGVCVDVKDEDIGVQFSVNGRAVGGASFASRDAQLCAAVSMLRKGSKTLLFCCAAQWSAAQAAGRCSALCDAR